MLLKGLKSLVKACLIKATRKRTHTVRRIESIVNSSYYRDGKRINYSYRAPEAMNYLLKNCNFSTVLDVRCGEGLHSDTFLKAGKSVTAIDYGKSHYFAKMEAEPGFSCIVDNFMTHDFGNEKFDCVWCSHVLEHQLNTQDFLKKLVSLVKTTNPGGGGY